MPSFTALASCSLSSYVSTVGGLFSEFRFFLSLIKQSAIFHVFSAFFFFFFVGKSCLLLVPSEIFIKISKGVILRDNIEMMFLKKMKRLSPQIIDMYRHCFT